MRSNESDPIDSLCINSLAATSTANPASAKVYFLYDEQGQLIGEYNASGEAIQEHIWFTNMPVAVIKNRKTYYVHNDHLNTPRAVVDEASKVIWRWDSDPFGTTAANEDPDGDGGLFGYNLRFPGQYYDSETGLHYNYFRYYDPSTGRYITSDPIGLAGGLNTYTYALDNPLRWTDPLGLEVLICRRPAQIAWGLVDHTWVRTDTMNVGLGGNPNVRPGDAYELPYVTDTYVIDHSNDEPTSCEKMNNVDEQCVNDVLSEELGTRQGGFGPYMNCQAYSYSVVNRCRTGPQMSPAR